MSLQRIDEAFSAKSVAIYQSDSKGADPRFGALHGTTNSVGINAQDSLFGDFSIMTFRLIKPVQESSRKSR